MRHDVTVLSEPSSPSTTGPVSDPIGPPSPARSRASAWLWPGLLAVVVTATCLTVAVYASAWLVAPYLVGMMLILGVPRPLRLAARVLAGWTERQVTTYRRARSERRPAVPSGSDGRRLRPGSAPDPEVGATAVDAPAPSDEPPPAPLPEAPEVKPRRARGRARKARPAPVAESPRAEARWVRVGPGKFVRVEPGEPLPDGAEAADVAAGAAYTEDPNARLPESEVRDDPETRVEDDGVPTPDFPAADRAEATHGDNGIAPDAPEVLPTDEPAGEAERKAAPVVDAPVPEWRSEPAPEAVAEVSRCPGPDPEVDEARVDGVAVDEHAARREPAASRVAVRRRPGLAPPRVRAASAVAVAPRWNARAGRSSRVLPGFLRPAPARRNLRHSGRFHHADRTYPPRSPPALTR